ncbi:hypothetical protein [Spirillospora sp. CA-294931]|uniref:hypothetical protein n=1 Tax=Spirillospora sp. CA-294931 TaxID=3240042 RepID=UPI003D8C72F7
MDSKDLDRRRLLRSSAGAAAAAGLGMLGVAAAAPAAAATPESRQVPRAPQGGELPPVPGMSGDRRANELWYQLDEVTLHHRPPEVMAAFVAIQNYMAGGAERGLVDAWQRMVKESAYPSNFTEFVTPIRQPLSVLAEVQAEVFDAVYPRGGHRLAAAFADFGQGVLYDPRHRSVHTMDGRPPRGYHVWHVYLRAMMFLGLDASRWREIAPLNGFAWAVQTVAKPSEEHPNPPLPRSTVRRLARTWLRRGPERLDIDFQSFPYPAGMESPGI